MGAATFCGTCMGKTKGMNKWYNRIKKGAISRGEKSLETKNRNDSKSYTKDK